LAGSVPAICSDLPALREVGGDVPEYFDPLDGVGWMDAVAAYALEASERRSAQVQRMAAWRGARWSEHVRTAVEFSDSLMMRQEAA